MVLENPQTESSSAATTVEADETIIQSVASELKRRFERTGCMARIGDFAQLFPRSPLGAVNEALHRLCEEQVAEINCLSDGGLVFQFPRR
jgi:hypothetical protein